MSTIKTLVNRLIKTCKRNNNVIIEYNFIKPTKNTSAFLKIKYEYVTIVYHNIDGKLSTITTVDNKKRLRNNDIILTAVDIADYITNDGIKPYIGNADNIITDVENISESIIDAFDYVKSKLDKQYSNYDIIINNTTHVM